MNVTKHAKIKQVHFFLLLCCISITLIFNVTAKYGGVKQFQVIYDESNQELMKQQESPSIKSMREVEKTQESNLASCRRHCHQRTNKIYYMDRPAGLNDRKTVIHYLSELAAYLCAELILPSPSAMLDPLHNNEKEVEHTVHWSDFYNISLVQDQSPAVREETSIFEESWREFPAFDSTKDKENILHLVSTDEDTRDHFEQAQRLSWNQPTNSKKRFVWEIHEQFYDFDLWQHDIPILPEGTRDAATGQLYSPEMKPFSMNYRDHRKSGCQYTHNETRPWHLRVLRNRLKKQIEDHALTNSIYGLLHLRRGDAVDVCDSSLNRVRSYLRCSLNGTEHRGRNFTILLTTDETDVGYRQRVLDEAKEYPHVAILDADRMTKEIVSEAGKKKLINDGLNNNFYIFEVQNMLRGTAWSDGDHMTDFHMVFRRSICRDCIPLDAWLSIRFRQRSVKY